MRKIDLNNPNGPSRITMMVTGASRSGKTHLAARFPRPVFLSDHSEGGWMTIEHMADQDFYEEGRVPEIYTLEKPADMIDSISDLENRIRQDSTSFGTVVVDSLTFYAEMYFAHLEADQMGKRTDNRQLYGALASHLRWVMIRIHKLPVNVLWLSLTKDAGEEGGMGGLSVPGQTATKAPARCDIWAYMEQTRNNKGPIYRLHTQNYGGFKAGHRFGDMLPAMIENPSYLDIEKQLQLAPWLDRLGPKKPKTKKAK